MSIKTGLKRLKGHKRALFGHVLRIVPFHAAMGISKSLMAAHGMGTGGFVGSSGERGVFRLIKAPRPVLFDVGGHTGEYSEAFLDDFPEGSVFVFEPSTSHVNLLRQRLAGKSNVTVFPVGLAAEAGTRTLYKDRDVSGLASLSQRRLDHFNIRMDIAEAVAIRTVDDVVAETAVTSIDLLKLDVEGHELAVMQGAVEAMTRGTIRLVQFEFGGCNLDTRTSLQDFFYFFRTYNFSIGLVSPSGRIHVLDKYNELYEQYRTTNFVAAPRSVLSG